ncbi:hypothetical protein AiwAL_11930 [Acidiphilium sp. AL]|uniref:Cytochrome c oxidase subunit 2A n=1 Tax=Acidiphilium iwatense TaxID=768198 RepID=A0ABS9DXV2_9PROT|nr:MULTISPECIES: hypothetical protein [Acidiphilium]MCF3947573.1 hypothetical protein [Acidiphilium iwatense]MCU4160810.1 hypothetical protein [Acidiphilium sp. AL]
MTETQNPAPAPPAPSGDDFKPRGAILIVALVGVTTLIVWFSLFALTVLRYAP